MALSNIFREPRREITESVVGIVAVVPLGLADYVFGLWFRYLMGGPYDGPYLLLSMLIGIFLSFICLVVGLVFLGITHAIGDGICNILQNRGIHLRPRQRY